MALSDDGKGFLVFVSIIAGFVLVIMLAFGIMNIMFQEVEYKADCSISGVNIGIDEKMNFTGMNLNNSEIKCDISGEIPLIILWGMSE